MKNIKLKHFAVALIMVLQWSCATHEPLIDAKNDPDVNSNSTQFDIIPGMNYIVDGKEITDRTLITTIQKKAWGIHFDLPENKVVISTTEREYDKSVNSDESFKQRLEENTRNAAIQQKEEFLNSNPSARVSAGPLDTPTIFPIPDFNNTLFFNIGFIPDKQANYAHYSFKAASNSDVYNIDQFAVYTSVTLSSRVQRSKILSETQIKSTQYKVGIRNTAESGSRTITFYASVNFGGTPVSYTIGANQSIVLPRTYRFKSYK